MEYMRNEVEKFNHSINVLVKAYLNDTLVHGNCAACAVGNLVADACNYTYVKSLGNLDWRETNYPSRGNGGGWFELVMNRPPLNKNTLTDKAKFQIEKTGYTEDELYAIEGAFESVGYENPDQYMYDGLMAVVDILAEIHGISLEQKQQAKALFVCE